MRAVAVMLVLAHHAGVPPHGGYVGVDIFFVISGFLITGLLVREAEREETISLVRFYARRAKRLLPLATLVLVLCAFAGYFLAPLSDKAIVGVDIAYAAGYLSNWGFAARSVDYLAEDLGRSPTLHYWSLSVEEQFYLLWPVLVLAAAKLALRKKCSLRVTLVPTLLLVVVSSFTWSLVFTRQASAEAFFVSTTRFWELGVGALLALSPVVRPKRGIGVASFASVIGAGLLIYAAFVFDRSTPWPSYRAALPVIGTALIIFAGSLSPNGLLTKLLSQRVMVAIGGLSYPLYLWHWPMIVLGQDWLGFEGPKWGVLLVLASAVPAWLSHRFVEEPFRFSSRFKGPSLTTVSIGLNVSLLTIVLGLLLQQRATPSAAQGGPSLEIVGKRIRVLGSQRGAADLPGKVDKAQLRTLTTPVGELYPPPTAATKDVPAAYPLGCQASFNALHPHWCIIGAKNGSIDVAVVGDSKILQYYEALDVIGQTLNWRIRTATKSSCGFHGGDTLRDGSVYEECARFNQSLLKELKETPPDLLITSQSDNKAFFKHPSKPGDRGTHDTMRRALRKYWSELTRAGIPVAVVLDNPHPPSSLVPVYECVAEHSDYQQRCAFELEVGLAESSALVQREAASGLAGVHIVDLSQRICPGGTCLPVVGGILIYRQGTHLTNAYAKSLAPDLLAQLRKVPLPRRAK